MDNLEGDEDKFSFLFLSIRNAFVTLFYPPLAETALFTRHSYHLEISKDVKGLTRMVHLRAINKVGSSQNYRHIHKDCLVSGDD